MAWTRRMRLRFQTLFRRRRSSQWLDREIQFHIEQQIAENIDAGMSPDEARRAAVILFGNTSLLRERTMDTWGGILLGQIAQDVRYALRTLRKNPGFTAVAVLTLTLGIGINSVAFSLINELLIRPLPVSHPERLVVLATRDKNLEFPHESSFPNYRDIRSLSGAFTDVIAYTPQGVNLDREGQITRSWVLLATGSYFDMLGVPPMIGRTFNADEQDPNTLHPSVVLSYNFWLRKFAADPMLLGKSIMLNGFPCTVIGVMPESFPGTETMMAFDAYAPVGMLRRFAPGSAGIFERREQIGFRLMARLKDGVSVENARSALDHLAIRLEQEYPEANSGVRFIAAPEVRSRPVIEVAETFPRLAAMLMAIAGLVFVIACANVANLLFERGAVRRKEMALRIALGASRGRLVRQLIVESGLLAVLGGISAGLAQIWAVNWIGAQRISTSIPGRLDIHSDWRVFLFGSCTAMVAIVFAGLMPSMDAARVDLNEVLKGLNASARRPTGGMRLRGGVVIAQVCFSTVLLVACALLVRSAGHAAKTELGFRTENVEMISVDPGSQGYSREKTEQFYKNLMDKARVLPGVRSAAMARAVPLGYYQPVERVSSDDLSVRRQDEAHPIVFSNIVTPSYFTTTGTPMLGGRDFSDFDDAKSERAVIVNKTLARLLWPVEDAVGKKIRIGGANTPARVIGVARDSKWAFLGETPRPLLYLPLAQNYASQMTLEVWTSASSPSISSDLLGIIKELDPVLAPFDRKSMLEHLEKGRALIFVRSAAWLAGGFGSLGLVLAVVGVYGLVAYSVSRRTAEIGIRMALGASARDIFRLVVGRGLKWTAIGLVIGLLASALVARLMASLLYDVSEMDPLTFAGISALMIVAVTLACCLPARRASRVEPMIALQHD